MSCVLFVDVLCRLIRWRLAGPSQHWTNSVVVTVNNTPITQPHSPFPSLCTPGADASSWTKYDSQRSDSFDLSPSQPRGMRLVMKEESGDDELVCPFVSVAPTHPCKLSS